VLPSGILYGEKASVRGAVARALAEEAAGAETGSSDLLAQTSTVATAVAQAQVLREGSATGGAGDDGLAMGGVGVSEGGDGGTPARKFPRSFRRDSRHSHDSTGSAGAGGNSGEGADLDSLVAGTGSHHHAATAATGGGNTASGRSSPTTGTAGATGVSGGGGGVALRLRSTRTRVLASLDTATPLGGAGGDEAGSRSPVSGGGSGGASHGAAHGRASKGRGNGGSRS